MSSFDQVIITVSRFSFSDVIWVLAAGSLHFITEPWRWQCYLGKLLKINFPRLFGIFSLSAFLSYLLPMKMGVPARLALLKLVGGVPWVVSSGYLLMDAVIYYSMYLVFSILLMLTAVDLKGDKITATSHSLIVGLIVIVVIALILWNLCRKALPYFTGKHSQWLGLLQKLYEQSSVRGMLLPAVAILVDMGSIVLRHWLIFMALDIQLSVMVIFAVSVISFTIGMISMMPLGIGGYDLTLIFLLSQYGVPLEVAAVVSVSNHVVNIFWSLVLGVWGGLSLGINPFSISRWKGLIREGSSR